MIKVVLDSTEITRDWLLRGLDFRVLRYLRSNYRALIGIPAVVIEEVKGNHDRAAEAAKREMRLALREYARLGLPLPTASDDAFDYASQLEHAIDILGAETLSWPTTSHADLAARAIERRPPFNTKGGGYRDTLVWASLLEYAKSGSSPEKTILVSKDKAFSDGHGRLHPSLLSEAASARVDVELVTDLGAWARNQVTWLPGEPLPAVAAAARDDAFVKFLHESDFPYFLDLEPHELGLPRSIVEMGVDDVVTFGDVERISVRSLSGSGTLVEYRVELDVKVDADVESETADQNGWPHGEPDIIGRVYASFTMKLDVRVSALFDLYDNDFDVDVVSISRSDGWQPPAEPLISENQLPLFGDGGV